jgi:hypothetical protein
MKQIVISAAPDGTLQTLRDKDMDLSTLGGTRTVVRITDILFDEEEQHFYIKWLKGPYKNLVESRHSTLAPESLAAYVHRGVLYFKTYEIAVQHEIARVNELRLSGATFT